jgi:hypothetical protein
MRQPIAVVLSVVSLLFFATTALALWYSDDRATVVAIAAIASSLCTAAITAAFSFSQHEQALKNSVMLAERDRIAEARSEDVRLLRDYVRVCLHADRQGRLYEISARISEGRIAPEILENLRALARDLRARSEAWIGEFGDFDRVIATVNAAELIDSLRDASSSQARLLAHVDEMDLMWEEPDGPRFTEAAQVFSDLRAKHEAACRHVSAELERYATGAPAE